MPVTRELTITYGAFQVGGATSRQITGFTSVERGYERSSIEFSFVTTATTAAAFATEVDAIEDAFRTPRLALTVVQGSSTLLSFSQTDNTGFDADPKITKRGDPGDTGRSRHYTVRIEFGEPADNVSTNYRRGSTITIEYSPSRRRTVTISGAYTATSAGTASRAQYLAEIAAYATSVLAAIDSTNDIWEKTSEPQVDIFETDKVCNFTVVYKEIVYNQSTGGLNHAAIVDPILIISREKEAPGDSIGIGANISAPASGGSTTQGGGFIVGAGSGQSTNRPTVINVTYSCSVDKTVTTDLSALWLSAVRGAILFALFDVNDGSSPILVEEKPSFDFYENKIAATMKFLVYSTNIFEQRIQVSDSTQYGRVLVPLLSSKLAEFYDYPGPVIRTRKIVEERKQIVPTANADVTVSSLVKFPKASVSGFGDIKEIQNWIVVSRVPTSVNLVQGISTGAQKTIAEITIETILQYRIKRAPSTNSAGGVTTRNLPS